MTLESKENYPRHTKIVQNSLGFMPEVKPLHKPRGDFNQGGTPLIQLSTEKRAKPTLRDCNFIPHESFVDRNPIIRDEILF